MHGYMGKYLLVDLSSEKIEICPLSISLLKKFVGGIGVNLKLMQLYSKPGQNEYSPGNPVIIGSGPLVGTLAPASSKTFVTTKFPLNHGISTAVGGMNFSRRLKQAGFDHVVIMGQAKRPLYLRIEDGKAFLREADDLWGLDLYETTEKLWERHGHHHSVIAIGPAGENLVRISLALIDNIASLGKGGLAAVLGSKRLKALVAAGSGGISVADPRNFIETAKKVADSMKSSPVQEKMLTLGSMAGWHHWSEVAGIPYKGSSEIYPREMLRQDFGPERYLKDVTKKVIACPSCYLPCKEIYQFSPESEDNDETRFTFASSFIGRVTAFGARCGVGSIPKALECHELCSRLGLDTYSISAAIDYVFKLKEDGRLREQDTDGLDLKRGFASTMSLIEQTAFRKGIGAKLADGFDSLGETLGEEFKSRIKGVDFIFDPRNYRLGTYEFEQVVNPRGGHQHAGGSPTYGSRDIPLDLLRKFCKAMSLSDSEIDRIFATENDFNVARLTKHCEEYYTAYSLLGLCSRKSIKGFYSLDTLARLYTSATGFDTSPRALKLACERVWNLLKLLNVAEGFDRDKDRFPDSWFEPIKDGNEQLYLMDYYGKKRLTPDDLQALLNDYYDEHGWSLSCGVPTIETAKKLDLEEEWQDLFSIEIISST